MKHKLHIVKNDHSVSLLRGVEVLSTLTKDEWEELKQMCVIEGDTDDALTASYFFGVADGKREIRDLKAELQLNLETLKEIFYLDPTPGMHGEVSGFRYAKFIVEKYLGS